MLFLGQFRETTKDLVVTQLFKFRRQISGMSECQNVTCYYGGEKLPLSFHQKLAKKYAGKKVFGVTETTTDGELIYDIILEDENNLIYVRANAFGNMSTTKKYKKA